MFLLDQMFPAVAASAAVSLLVGTGAVLWGRGWIRMHPSLAAFALATGYVGGHLTLTGWMSLPPVDAINWLPVFALAVAAAGSLLSFLPHNSARWIAAGLLSVAALRLLLQPKFQHAWAPAEGWIWVISLALAVMLLAGTLQALARRSSTRVEIPVLLLIVCTGSSGALALSGSLLLGQLAAALAASFAGLFLLGWRASPNSATTAWVFSLLHISLLVSGCFYAELRAASALLLGAAPAVALTLTPLKSSRALRISAARIALTFVVAVLALYLAWRSSPPLLF